MNRNESYIITNSALLGFLVIIGLFCLAGLVCYLDLKEDFHNFKEDFHNLVDKVSNYNDRIIRLEAQMEYLLSKNID